MKLAIVTISYNTKDVLRNCLQSLRDIDDLEINKDFHVIVAENGSSDGSLEMLQTEFPDITLQNNNANIGFSRGNNSCLPYVHESCEYVLFLNSDTTVPTGTLSEMLDFMDNHRDVGLSTCKVMLTNGDIDWDCHRGFPTAWVALTRILGLNRVFPQSKMFNQYYQGWKDMNTTHEIDACVGAFMLVRKKVGNEIEWWDEDYFLNGEDIDFCYCVKEKGYKVMYHPKVTIMHYRGVSKGTRKESKKLSNAQRKRKEMVAHASVDAMQLFYNKHYRSKDPWIVNTVVDGMLKVLRLYRVRFTT